jgi:hypothetical protein
LKFKNPEGQYQNDFHCLKADFWLELSSWTFLQDSPTVFLSFQFSTFEILISLLSNKNCSEPLSKWSDHGALSWLLNFKNPEGQLARWFEVLASYDFRIEHRAGRSHINTDALSRRPCYNYNTECAHCTRAEKYFESGCFIEATTASNSLLVTQ